MSKFSVSPRLVALALAAFLVTACTPSNIQPTATASNSPEALIAAAQKTTQAEQRDKLLLQAADALQQRADDHRARQVLKSVAADQLSPALRDQYLLLSMRSAVNLNDVAWAQNLAPSLKVDLFNHYPSDKQPQAALLESKTLALANQPVQAAATLVAANKLFSGDQAHQNRNQIWQWLESADNEALQQAAKQSSSYNLQGWLELAMSLHQAGQSLDQQSREIRQWQQNWANHPAASQLPDELALIVSLVQQRPERLVLALPLSGNLADAGKAILEGFVGAFYQDQRHGEHKTHIDVVDTGSGDFMQHYQEIMAKSPDLVIGPLAKASVAELAKQPSLPVPVLALNYLDDPNAATPDNLFQYGLSPDDDARQIAERLRRDGDKKVLAILPQGDWGDRVLNAFQDSFTQLDGDILDTSRFAGDDTLKQAVANLLGVAQSRDRAIQVERTIGLDVKFEPRRRQDADAIFMVAPPAVARQIKPLLEFYFAGDLPVYATSLVYTGIPNPQRDVDLDGVRFTDLPWILANQNPLRQEVSTTFPSLFGQYDRLFAMGADAYLLSSRLPLLKQVQGSMVDGSTGLLTMDDGRHIHRKLDWAMFKNGAPQLLPADQTDTTVPASDNSQSPQNEQPAGETPDTTSGTDDNGVKEENNVTNTPGNGSGDGTTGQPVPAQTGPASP